MGYQVQKLEDHQCPLCEKDRPGTKVSEVPERGLGNHYLYVNCRSCGQTVSRILGFKDGEVLTTGPLEPEEVAELVIRAVREANGNRPGDAN
jgi:hypothetical protein